ARRWFPAPDHRDPPPGPRSRRSRRGVGPAPRQDSQTSGSRFLIPRAIFCHMSDPGAMTLTGGRFTLSVISEARRSFMSTFQLPAASERLLAWLAQVGRSGSFGVLRTPEGEEFVVARPEHLAELDSILSDPGFVEALEQGVSDVVAARIRTMEGS